MIEVPIVIQFDPEGRLWVVEMRGFMRDADGFGETNRLGRISILEDTDDDGRMDHKKIFLDGLVLPRAMLLAQDGVLVCEPPKLWFYPNHNDSPGERVLVADDFAKDADPALGPRMNPDHSGSSLFRAMDNWIYSLYHPYRYRFAQGQWTRERTPKRVQWGLTQDDFGRLFYSANNDHLRADLVPSHYAAETPAGTKKPGISVQIAKDQTVWPIRVNPGINRGYQPGMLRPDGRLAKFTAACGTSIYRGVSLPSEFYGNAFVCEPAANLVRRNILTEKDGLITAKNAYREAEFLASVDELFRPVNTCNGPDGALYIADMYHGIIQHRFFLTPYLRKQSEERGLYKVTEYGRIYRVAPAAAENGSRPVSLASRDQVNVRPAARRRAVKPRLSGVDSAELVGHLAHRNGWWRDTAQRLLVERGEMNAVPDLERLAALAPEPLTRLHALWTLEGMGQLRIASVSAALSDPHAKVRATATRLSEAFLRTAPSSAPTSDLITLREKVGGMVNDTAADVQIQLALTLGEISQNGDTRNLLGGLAKSSPFALAREAAAFSLARLESAKPQPALPVSKAKPMTPEEEKQFQAGKEMYEITCLACHQQHGMGQEGLAPPLVGSEWVAGPPGRLIRIVLQGMRGPIKVKGQIFELDMPGLGVLDDEQVANALTYIRREWGHTYDPVSPELVRKVRAATADREAGWTEAELLEIK